MEDHANERTSGAEANSLGSRRRLGAALMLALIFAFYLLREHWGHIAGFWPYLLLLACPLMHLFHHGSHGAHGHHEHRERDARPVK